jgi:hypothetical protein
MRKRAAEFARYLNVRSAYHPTFGLHNSLAFLADLTGVPQVWALERAGGWPEPLTFFQERIAYPAIAEFLDRHLMG